MPIYGQNAHLADYILCVSPLADLNENQLTWKACYLKMTSSFQINLSLSCCLFLRLAVLWLFTLQVTHHARERLLLSTSTTANSCTRVHTACANTTQRAEVKEKVTCILLNFYPPLFFLTFFIQASRACSPHWTVPPGLPQRYFAEHSERACWALTERPWDSGGVY